jgi:hypothetical protein
MMAKAPNIKKTEKAMFQHLVPTQKTAGQSHARTSAFTHKFAGLKTIFNKEDTMKSTVAVPVVVCMVLCILSGCASIGTSKATIDVAMQNAKMIPTEIPMPIKTIEVYDSKQKKRVEADVLSLKSSEIRSRLTSTETFITVEQRDSSGKLTYLGAGGKVAKGSYRVTFDYANYTNQNISFSDGEKDSVIGRIGVGLRITAELQTLASGIDLGGLLPIGLAAQDQKVSGHIGFLVYGMSNDKVSIAAPTQSILDVSSIQKAFESAAAVRILFGLEETKLEPYLIGVADIKPADAKKAIEAATKKLVK